MPTISHVFSGQDKDQAKILVVWAHGWGHDKTRFDAFRQPFLARAAHLAVDFPGFGASPPPPENWTTAEYADAMATLIAPYRAGKKLIWVGHSFGGRVGVQLAARHPDLVDGLFLIAAAGLRRRRGVWGSVKFYARIGAFKIAKYFTLCTGGDVDALRARFGSADYKNAGALRRVFLSVIKEDLSAEARKITIPARLIYGEKDSETPPEMGERFARLMQNATCEVLPGVDHNGLLQSAVAQKRFSAFLESFV